MKFLRKKLEEREREGTLRKLSTFSQAIDFYSNDYLGMALDESIHHKAKSILLENEMFFRNGSGGSRLLSGNFEFYDAIEQYLADFFHADSALVFHSGYDALLGVLSCLPGRSDTILYDELVHASARDGIRLSSARNFSFRHNDYSDLEAKLKRSEGQVFVVVESIYSMDGDSVDLDLLLALQKKYEFVLLIDEAHAGGVKGEAGKGLSYAVGKQENIIRFITFGKAYGVEGACVLGSDDLKAYLINFSRPFIYTTAPSPAFFANIRASVDHVAACDAQRLALYENMQDFKNRFSHYFPCTDSAIQLFKPGSKRKLNEVSTALTEHGFAIKPIFSPTVKEGEERLRIVLHAFNDEFQLDGFEAVIKAFL